ncbi:group-specific protein [Lysinibacillus sp. NPDC097287]|uniref:group-specific protein n=1 Tax=Lysinibacillus sp. NPDC097287 TaxID=3364144 RepID=UPI0037F19B65
MMRGEDLNKNHLTIRSSAPYSLNYLVFIQNIFENSQNVDNQRPLFPYVDSSQWGLLQGVEFKITFKELWNEAVNKNMKNSLYDHNGIFELEPEFYQRLFEDDDNGRFGYSESVKLFLSWWGGIYGQMAVERVCVDHIQNIYWKLSESIKPIDDMTLNRQLILNIVYEKPLYGGTMFGSRYAVLHTEEVFINWREIATRLLDCCEDQ